VALGVRYWIGRLTYLKQKSCHLYLVIKTIG